MKFLLTCSILALTTRGIYEQIDYKEYKNEQGTFTCIAASPNGYTVAADKEGIVYLWDPSGNLQSKQSYHQFGQVALIDASNPLDIFIYFRLNRRLLVLDNQLNTKKELDFNALQNYYVLGLGRSSDGNCWIIDARERLLRKIDFSGKSLQSQTINLRINSKGFSAIRDNGNLIMCGAKEDTILNIYTSSLIPRPGFIKPRKSWSSYGNNIYVPMDDSRVVSFNVSTAKRDTLLCSGTFALHDVQVSSKGMVNLNQGNLGFYRSGNE